MQLLVATNKTQGDQPNDFTFAVDGELVMLGMVCDCDIEDPDGGCGYGQSFSGLNSHRATTTAEVVDLMMSRDDVAMGIGSSLHQAGWCKSESEPEELGDLAEWADELIELGSGWPVGTVLERRLDEVRERS